MKGAFTLFFLLFLLFLPFLFHLFFLVEIWSATFWTFLLSYMSYNLFYIKHLLTSLDSFCSFFSSLFSSLFFSFILSNLLFNLLLESFFFLTFFYCEVKHIKKSAWNKNIDKTAGWFNLKRTVCNWKLGQETEFASTPEAPLWPLIIIIPSTRVTVILILWYLLSCLSLCFYYLNMHP